MTDPDNGAMESIMCCAHVTSIAQDHTILDQSALYPADMGNLATSTPYGETNLNRKNRQSWFETSPLRLEITVEKPAVKAVKQISETVEVLNLTHFTAPRLGFGSIKLGQMKVCTLLLQNPHDYQQSVKVEKVPEKKGFSVECREMVVGAHESFPLEVTWFPLEVGRCQEMIVMQVDRAYRLQAYVFGTVTAAAQPSKKNLGHIVNYILDAATRLSPQCCERIVEVNAIMVLYRLICKCNRSLPHMEVIKYTINILINLAKYEKTRYSVYEDPESMSTLVSLMQIYREKGVIFLKTCFLIGVLALDDICKKIITEDKKLVEKLQGIYTLTVCKHQLDAKQKFTRERLSIASQSIYVTRSTTRKPKIKPDWSLHKDSMQEIDKPLMAMNFVKVNLGLTVK